MPKAKPRIRRARGTLATLCALLLVSALVRLGDHAGSAFAAARPSEDGIANASPASDTPSSANPPEIQIVLDALDKREKRISRTERALNLRFAALEEAEIEIDRKLADLRAAEAALRETLAIADQAAEKDLARLTAVYENMKPKQAAALFETMDPGFVAGFLGRMKPAAAAGILAGLAPETAYSISAVLAGRNAEAPRQ